MEGGIEKLFFQNFEERVGIVGNRISSSFSRLCYTTHDASDIHPKSNSVSKGIKNWKSFSSRRKEENAMIRRRRRGLGVGAYRAEMTMAERQIAFEWLARKAKQQDLERDLASCLG